MLGQHLRGRLHGACPTQVRGRPQGSAIADEAIKRIAQLYAVEKEARGSPPNHRIEVRQGQAKPVFDALAVCLHTQLLSISGKSPLAGAIRYALMPISRLWPYLDHGILELDSNTAERAMQSVAIGRKNYIFVGSKTGGKAG
ncbi:transposase [Sulfitobacter sp. HNIBRBA3233]